MIINKDKSFGSKGKKRFLTIVGKKFNGYPCKNFTLFVHILLFQNIQRIVFKKNLYVTMYYTIVKGWTPTMLVRGNQNRL